MTCFFCCVPAERVLYEDDLVMVLRDGFPVSPGHSLVVPRRHVQSWFDATEQEQIQLMRALSWARGDLQTELQPDAFNIGINDGPIAGQSVPHLHIHLIPRYQGDHNEARGGVRWIFPDKANYWD